MTTTTTVNDEFIPGEDVIVTFNDGTRRAATVLQAHKAVGKVRVGWVDFILKAAVLSVGLGYTWVPPDAQGRERIAHIADAEIDASKVERLN